MATPIEELTDEEIDKEIGRAEVERWAAKIAVNALYGLFASSYYRFKAVEVADSITYHGRDILTHTAEFLRSMGYTVYYMDTDSCFVRGKIEEADTIRDLMNSYVQRTYNVDNIKFGLENHWSLLGFPRGAKGEKTKKRYYGIVHVNKKGEVVDKFEEAGMEGLRGDWCELARNVQDTIKRFQVTKVPKEKMVEFYEDTKVRLYKGLYDPLLVMEKHMGKDVSEYGQMKKDEKTGRMRKSPTPQHVKALRDAMEHGWVPSDMVQYGVVQYYMCRGAIPKLVNLVKPGEIDYGWYCSHQLEPIVWRLGIIEAISKYKKTKTQPENQQTLVGSI